MKKIIALVCAAVVGVSAFALDVTAGARGTFAWGLGTTLPAEDAEQMKTLKEATTSAGGTWSEGGNLGGGFGVYANLGLVNLGNLTLGLQPEFNMLFNNGYTVDYALGGTSQTVVYTDNSIDIPVLVTLSLPVTNTFAMRFGVGPYLSIPLGLDLITTSGGTETRATDTTGVTIESSLNFGLAFDVNFTNKLGIGSLVANVRYMLDFTPTKATIKYNGTVVSDNEDLLTRRALTVGIGYEIKF